MLLFVGCLREDTAVKTTATLTVVRARVKSVLIYSIPLAPGFFRGRVIPVTKKLALQWLPLPGAWRYRVSAGTGRPGVSIL